MKKLIIIILLLSSILIAGCVDNTKAIQHCESVGLQYTGKKLGCDIECLNVTSAEKFTYEGDCRFIG